MAVADVPYPQLHEVAGTELAVDSQIKKGEFSTSTCDLQSYANRPYLLEFEWRFLTYELSLVPGLTSGNCGAGVHDRLLMIEASSLQFQLSWPIDVDLVYRATVANRPLSVLAGLEFAAIKLSFAIWPLGSL